MKTFSIDKHSLRHRVVTERANYTNCSEAFATYDDNNGYRLIGFDRDGRRWSITIDEQLAADLTSLYTKRGGSRP